MSKNVKIWTPSGKVTGPQSNVNSKVGKDEIQGTPDMSYVSQVTEGTVGVDNQNSSVSVYDDNWILSATEKDSRTGIPYAKEAEPAANFINWRNKQIDRIKKGSELSSLSKQTLNNFIKNTNPLLENAKQTLQNVLDQQHKDRIMRNGKSIMNNNMMMAKCGKDKPHYAEGKIISDWDLFRDNAPGLGLSIAQGLHWKNQPIQYHNTYSSNPYAASALQGLSSLRENPYQAYDEANQQARQAKYSLSQAGGLSGAQRYAGMLGQDLAMFNTWARLQKESQRQNNAYKSQYWNAALQQGNQDRTARMQANQHDWDDYIKAHGAKIKGIETAMANVNNMWRQMAADRFKGEMADKTNAIYNKMVENDSKRIEADSNKNIGSTFEYRQNNDPLFKSYDFLGNPDVMMPWNIRFRKDDWRTPYLNMQAVAKAQQNGGYSK